MKIILDKNEVLLIMNGLWFILDMCFCWSLLSLHNTSMRLLWDVMGYSLSYSPFIEKIIWWALILQIVNIICLTKGCRGTWNHFVYPKDSLYQFGGLVHHVTQFWQSIDTTDSFLTMYTMLYTLCANMMWMLHIISTLLYRFHGSTHCQGM